MESVVLSKICTKCKLLKLLREFSWRSKVKGTRHGWCKICMRAYCEIYRNSPEGKLVIKICREAYNNSPEGQATIRIGKKVYRNSPKGRAVIKAWENSPKGRAIQAASDKRPERKATKAAYAHNNPGRSNAQAAKRRTTQLQRTPLWSEEEAIRMFYIRCPRGMTVDHIIPLQGKLVFGLHVLSNLQYLTKSENSAKKNKFDPIKFNNLVIRRK